MNLRILYNRWYPSSLVCCYSCTQLQFPSRLWRRFKSGTRAINCRGMTKRTSSMYLGHIPVPYPQLKVTCCSPVDGVLGLCTCTAIPFLGSLVLTAYLCSVSLFFMDLLVSPMHISWQSWRRQHFSSPLGSFLSLASVCTSVSSGVWRWSSPLEMHTLSPASCSLRMAGTQPSWGLLLHLCLSPWFCCGGEGPLHYSLGLNIGHENLLQLMQLCLFVGLGGPIFTCTALQLWASLGGDGSGWVGNGQYVLAFCILRWTTCSHCEWRVRSGKGSGHRLLSPWCSVYLDTVG